MYKRPYTQTYHDPRHNTNTTNKTAKTEMEMYQHLFTSMAGTCFQKCASYKHKEPDLALGEMSCTDRCVSKYLEVQEKVGVILQKANEQQVAQQQKMMDMQNQYGG